MNPSNNCILFIGTKVNQLGIQTESIAPLKSSTQGTLNLFSDEFNLISNNLKEIGDRVNHNILSLDQRKEIRETLEQTADNITSQKLEVIERIEEMLDENRVLKGLATLGITNTVFAHETQGALNNIHLSIDNINRCINRIPNSFEPKEKLIKTINSIKDQNKIIKGWGNFALTRVEIDKRKNPKLKPINLIIEKAIKEISDAYSAVNIEIEDNLGTHSIPVKKGHSYAPAQLLFLSFYFLFDDCSKSWNLFGLGYPILQIIPI